MSSLVFGAEYWIATRDNVLVQDITDYVQGGSINFNVNREVRRQGSLDFWRDDVSALDIRPYRDYLAPFIVLTTDDGDPVRTQIGLYALRSPNTSRRSTVSLSTFPLNDLTYELKQAGFAAPYTMTGGELYTDEVIEAIEANGLTRHVIPLSSETVPADRTFWGADQSYLSVVNAGLQASGAYSAFTDGEGRIASAPLLPLTSVEPLMTVTNDDIEGDVEDTPPDRDPVNVVVVYVDRPNEPILVSEARNDDPASPTSTVSLGRVSQRTEKLTDVGSQAALDAIALSLLQEGRSYYETAKLDLLPNPAFGGRDVLNLQFSGNLEVYNGLWWVRTWTMGLTIRRPTITVEINRTTDNWRGLVI